MRHKTKKKRRSFTEVTMIVLKTPKAIKSSDHRTISLIAHIEKMVARILRRTERKIEEVLAEDQCGQRIGKGTRDTTGIVRIIPQRTLEIDEKLCAFFTDWQRHLTVQTGPN